MSSVHGRKRALRGGRQLAVALTALAMVFGPLAMPTQAQVPNPILFGEADFLASATGTVLHTDALQGMGTRVVDAEIAFSGAAVNSDGLAAADQVHLNEMEREFVPEEAGTNSYARGSGVEAGLGLSPPSTENQVIVAGLAEASAPPSDGPNTEEIGPVEGDPAVWAATARGRALANYPDPGQTPLPCILGADLARGLGYVEDAQLLDAGDDTAGEGMDQPVVALDDDGPDRAVSQSLSRNLLVGQFAEDGTRLGDNFGIMSESRQTIAPVTLFKGTPNEVTIEVLGEWVLQAVATGLNGGAYIHYGPGEVEPQTPILRLLNDQGEVTDILAFQDIFGDEGFTAINIPGLLEIAIGEDPRAIGGAADTDPEEAANGTRASAAVDVIRIKILEQVDDATGEVTQRAADLRVGHMEVQAEVPVGGISCPLPVTKTPNPAQVEEGQSFTTDITITNPYDCDLEQVRLVDEISVRDGAAFTITGTDPETSFPTGQQTSATIVWEDVGPIPVGESRTVTVSFIANEAGLVEDIATATATSLTNCSGEGAGEAVVAGVAIGVESVTLAGAARAEVLAAGAELPRTGPGAATAVLGGGALLGLAGLIRRRFIR